MSNRNSVEKLKEGMKFVSNEVIKKAKETNTKILITNEKGQPMLVTPAKMENIIKKSKLNNN